MTLVKADVEIVDKVSQKGNAYKQVNILFPNGFRLTTFPRGAEYFVLEQILSDPKNIVNDRK